MVLVFTPHSGNSCSNYFYLISIRYLSSLQNITKINKGNDVRCPYIIGSIDINLTSPYLYQMQWCVTSNELSARSYRFGSWCVPYLYCMTSVVNYPVWILSYFSCRDLLYFTYNMGFNHCIGKTVTYNFIYLCHLKSWR